MAELSLAGPIGEFRALHATAGGDASSTTPAFIHLPPGTGQVFIEGRNFSTAVAVRIGLCPWLVVMKTADNLATVTEYSDEAQDASVATDVVLSGLDTAANLDYLYVGSHEPFRGVSIDIDAANGNASVLTVNYWNGAWTTTGATDGSAATGATFGQDGNVTWTMPTDWVPATLVGIGSPAPSNSIQYRNEPLYWTRWQVSAALDASTTLNSMIAMSRYYGDLVSGRVLEASVRRGVKGLAAIEHRTDAGTANVIVNASPYPSDKFPS